MTGKYADFLLSDEWKDFANELKIERGGKCEICGVTEPLQVHHMKYSDDLMNKEDLIVLCEHCHKSFHRMIDRYQNQVVISASLPYNTLCNMMSRSILDLYQNSLYRPGGKSNIVFFKITEYCRVRDIMIKQIELKFPQIECIVWGGHIRPWHPNVSLEESGVLQWISEAVKVAANNGIWASDIKKRYRLSDQSYRKALSR